MGSGLMVYFNLKIIPFLMSILAFFSLTTSYLIPTLYKLRVSKGRSTQELQDSQLKQTLNEDVQVDVDFKGRRDEEQKHQLLQDYFAQNGGAAQQQTAGKRKEGPSRVTALASLVVNSTLVLLFVGLYGLLAYNFVYNTVEL